MQELPMPSDLGATSTAAVERPDAGEPPAPRRMAVRLFLIPLLIAAGIIAVMIPLGRLAGGPSSLEDAIAELRKTRGGERTAEVLVGPAAKQRYIAAQSLSLRMREAMERGMPDAQRVTYSDALLDVLQHATRADEGDIQSFVLLALGRVWQIDPARPAADFPDVSAARQRVLNVLIQGDQAYINRLADGGSAQQRQLAAATRKATILALGFWAGRPEAQQAAPAIIRKLTDDPDLDVRIAAASRLGAVARPDDTAAVDALLAAMRAADPKQGEIAWNAALSLAQMNRPEAADVLLMLLDRKQLGRLRVYDHDGASSSSAARPLSEEEQQRFLINAMQAAVKLKSVPAVPQKVRDIAQHDASPRVRAAAREVLGNPQA